MDRTRNINNNLFISQISSLKKNNLYNPSHSSVKYSIKRIAAAATLMPNIIQKKVFSLPITLIQYN